MVNSKQLNDFRDELTTHQWPDACLSCKLQEQERDFSFRIAVNKEDSNNVDYTWPRAWNIKFGNVCNLGCWTCNEGNSSVIFQHKKQSGIPLLINYDPGQTFLDHWPQLEKDILKSYKHHKIVTLTLLGGEPLYNKTVIDFLQKLIQLDLAKRTKLEITTNGTVSPDKLFDQTAVETWNYICIFVSLDATGKFVEWLRYGANWDQIQKNIQSFKQVANYVEIHSVLSVLNINYLYELDEYAKSQSLKLNVSTISRPNFMTLAHWDQPVESLLVRKTYPKYQIYYNLIGSKSTPGSGKKLINYIRSFSKVRKPLSDFAPELAKKMSWL